jgi:hypothetical protein
MSELEDTLRAIVLLKRDKKDIATSRIKDVDTLIQQGSFGIPKTKFEFLDKTPNSLERSIVLTDSPAYVNEILGKHLGVPVIYIASPGTNARFNNNMVDYFMLDYDSDTQMNHLADILLPGLKLAQTMSEEAPNHLKKLMSKLELNLNERTTKFAGLEREYDRWRKDEEVLISGHFLKLSQIVNDFSAAQMRAHTVSPSVQALTKAQELHDKAVEYATTHGIFEYAIAKERFGLSDVQSDVGASEIGEGGATNIGIHYLKPMTGDNHKEQAEIRYGLTQGMMFGKRHKPAHHNAPIHSDYANTSLFLLTSVRGPDVMTVLDKFDEAESTIKDKVLINRIQKARTNLVNTAIKDYAYWTGFWQERIKEKDEKRIITLPNKLDYEIETVDTVKQRYASNLQSLPCGFNKITGPIFAQEELETWYLSIDEIMDAINWDEKFISPYRDTYFKNQKFDMGSTDPSLEKILDICSDEEVLSQTIRHYDFGTRSCHVLEDLLHMTVTPSTGIAPKYSNKLKAAVRTFVQGLKEMKSKYAAVIEKSFIKDSKNFDYNTVLALAFYRTARKMGLTANYSIDAKNKFDDHEIEIQEMNKRTERFTEMFREYNESSRGYLNWLAKRIRDSAILNAPNTQKNAVKNEFRQFQTVYNSTSAEGLTPEQAKFVKNKIFDGDSPDYIRKVTAALYAESFLRKMDENFRGF